MTTTQFGSVEELFDLAVASPFDEMPTDVADLLDPQTQVDVRPLLTLIGQEERLPDREFIQTWLDWSKHEQGLFKRQDAVHTLSRLAYEVARFYRHHHYPDEVALYLEASWLRIAADGAHLPALLRLMQLALAELMPAKTIVVGHWAEVTIDQIKYTSYGDDEVELESHLNQLLKLIQKLATHHPSLALELSFKLMAAVQKHTNLQDKADALSENTDKIIAQMHGVRVLDGIEESTDRITRDAIKRYQGLSRYPVPLQRIDEIASIQQTLDDQFPWFEKLTRKIINALLLRQLGSGVFYLPPHADRG